MISDLLYLKHRTLHASAILHTRKKALAHKPRIRPPAQLEKLHTLHQLLKRGMKSQLEPEQRQWRSTSNLQLLQSQGLRLRSTWNSYLIVSGQVRRSFQEHVHESDWPSLTSSEQGTLGGHGLSAIQTVSCRAPLRPGQNLRHSNKLLLISFDYHFSSVNCLMTYLSTAYLPTLQY